MLKILRTLLIGITLLLALATVLPLLPVNHWWARVFDFPRVQIIGLATLTLLLYGILSRWKRKADFLITAVLVGVMGYQSVQVYPYTFVAENQTAEAQQYDSSSVISILASNVLMDNNRAEDLLDIVRQTSPDLVLLMEPNAWWQQQMDVLLEEYPYTAGLPLDNTYGMLLYSRLPLRQTEVTYLLEDSIPSIHTYVTLRSGQPVKLYCLHPKPPVPTESASSTERDAELLLVGKMVKNQNEPAIVAGDLNDVAWSPTTRLFMKASGMLDPRIGRGFYNTFDASHPLMRWPLDHLFHTEHFQLVNLQVMPYMGSDHFPVYFSLSYQPLRQEQQQKPEVPDEEEQEKANETIQEGFEKR